MLSGGRRVEKGGLRESVFIFAAAIALIFCICAVFGRGVGTGYIFDDVTSVIPLRALQDAPEFFWTHIFSNESGPLGRPISIATFGLEQIFLLAGPDLSQQISIYLHAFNSLLIFILAAQILKLACLSRPSLWALFIAALWALSPQKVSSVLYIVQRMTLLASMLSLLALIFYVKARLSQRLVGRCFYFFISGLSCIFAPFAKETGVLAVPLLAALEIFVVPDDGAKFRRVEVKSIARLVLLGGGVFFLIVGVRTCLQSEAAFSIRSFDFWYRLMSSPAVLIDYAKQFYIPDTTKMGLFHDDFSISFVSLSYFLSFFLLSVSIVFLSVSLVKNKNSLLAFSVSFYLIGHSIESFYLPLELYFEHRNYLPSFGLALLPLAALGRQQSKITMTFSRSKYYLLAAYLFFVSSASFFYVPYWGSYYTLLEHELRGHPGSARAHADYGLTIAEMGHASRAFEYIDLSRSLSTQHKAARSLGFGDAVALKVAAACLADAPLTGALAQSPVQLGDDPFRSNVLRVLSRLVADDVCPSADWRAVSDWLKLTIGSIYESDDSVRSYALRDLALFEREMGNFTLVYAYASMAAELRPQNGLLAGLKLESSLAAGDYGAAIQLCEEVHSLDASGGLSPIERVMFSRLFKEAGCPLD